jgi:hypothetical protein
MYIYEDVNNFYDLRHNYELENENLPLECPYRQLVPFSPFPQGPQGPQSGPPIVPPNFTPSQSQAQQFGATPMAIDSGAIRPCIHRLVYIWPRRGRGFWAWLTFVGRRSVSGFRWNRNTWRYFGMDLRNINSFQCF